MDPQQIAVAKEFDQYKDSYKEAVNDAIEDVAGPNEQTHPLSLSASAAQAER